MCYNNESFKNMIRGHLFGYKNRNRDEIPRSLFNPDIDNYHVYATFRPGRNVLKTEDLRDEMSGYVKDAIIRSDVLEFYGAVSGSWHIHFAIKGPEDEKLEYEIAGVLDEVIEKFCKNHPEITTVDARELWGLTFINQILDPDHFKEILNRYFRDHNSSRGEHYTVEAEVTDTQKFCKNKKERYLINAKIDGNPQTLNCWRDDADKIQKGMRYRLEIYKAVKSHGTFLNIQKFELCGGI